MGIPARLRDRRASPGATTAAAAVLASLAMLEVVLRVPNQPQVPLLLAALGTVPVAFARQAPLASSLVIVGATLLVASQRRPVPVAVVVALLVCAYVVGATRSAIAAATIVAPFVLVAVMQPWGRDTADRVGMLVLLGLAFAAVATGRLRRGREQAAALEATSRELDRTQLENAERGERARIARELHDVVAHHISMISVQAETARLTTPGLPHEGATQLAAIGETARTALTEMRRLLGVLRDDAGPERALQPQPSLRSLEDLVAEAGEAGGAAVRLVVRGTVEPLEPGMELVAYRIVQEALTNARRHAAAAAVEVELSYDADALRILVRDNGPGPVRDARPGHGILGMRERAAMLGGTLLAGAAPDGGYQVFAELPR